MIGLVLPDIRFEDELLARAKRGNQSAVMEIYDRYALALYQYVHLRVGDRALAEDITSEIFVAFIDSLQGKNAPRYSLRGWLFGVARNLIAHHYRDAGKLPQVTLEEWVPADIKDPEAQLLHSIDVEQTRHALRMLNTEQQEVLILRFGQLMSLRETAEVMGKSVSAIKSLQFRAVETLRQILDVSSEGSYGQS